MTPRLVAIHQPNFFPWLGFFDKLARADVFVLLDHVQFQKKGGTWTNRVRIRSGGDQSAWATVPVDRSYHGVRAINEVMIDDSTPWRPKLVKTIRTSYGRAPHFEQVAPVVEGLIETETDRLASLNEVAIRRLAEEMGYDVSRIILSSSLAPGGAGTEMLIGVIRAVGGDTYLVGGGAKDYQDDEAFGAAGIALREQAFEHPSYPQSSGRFEPGLSVIDALMGCGFSGVAGLLGASSA